MPDQKERLISRLSAVPNRLATSIRVRATPGSFVLNWPREGPVQRNWGDKLNPYMAQKLSSAPFVHRKDVLRQMGLPVHYWIGSHLSSACALGNSIVWGAGFISHSDTIPRAPRRICAVRGWKSVMRLRTAGIHCPDVVGDAALLLPKLYTPARDRPRARLGLIAHYNEAAEPFFSRAMQWEGTKLIDICGGIEEVVDEIVSCDLIASSSLHGIICADAYGVPSIWLRPSDRPSGDGFKFFDYFSSVGRDQEGPLAVHGETSRQEVEDHFRDYRIDIDLDALWSACPVTMP